jgi:hypothetical protein
MFRVALNILIATHGGHNGVGGDNEGGTGSVDVIIVILCFSVSVSVTFEIPRIDETQV